MMYLAYDPIAQVSSGDTPDKAIQAYIDEYNDYDIERLTIYQLTALKAKPQVSFIITGNSVGT